MAPLIQLQSVDFSMSEQFDGTSKVNRVAQTLDLSSSGMTLRKSSGSDRDRSKRSDSKSNKERLVWKSMLFRMVFSKYLWSGRMASYTMMAFDKSGLVSDTEE